VRFGNLRPKYLKFNNTFEANHSVVIEKRDEVMNKVFVAGNRGMVGSAICRQLERQPDVEVITRCRDDLDLMDQSAVYEFIKSEKPDEVILAAAKVGGIHANNTYPAGFIYQNLQIQNNVIHAAHMNDVQKLLFLGSSCIYPRAVE